MQFSRHVFGMASNGDVEGLKAFLNSQQDPRAIVNALITPHGDLSPHSGGHTLLQIAITNAHLDLAEALLRDCGADATVTDSSQKTALHHTVSLGSGVLLRSFLRSVASNGVGGGDFSSESFHLSRPSSDSDPLSSPHSRFINARDAEGRTALCVALTNGDVDAARILMEEFAADPFIVDNVGRSTLHCCAAYADAGLARMLLTPSSPSATQCGTPESILLSRNERGQSPLLLAAECGNQTLVKELIEVYRVDYLNTRGDGAHIDADKRTVLHAAVGNHLENDGSVMAYLATLPSFAMPRLHRSPPPPSRLVSVESKTTHGDTALHMAAKKGRGMMRCIRLLTEQMGANVGAVSTRHGMTPLHFACAAYGSDLDVDEWGRTPDEAECYARIRGGGGGGGGGGKGSVPTHRTSLLRYLIVECGADVDAQPRPHLNTPLMVALSNQNSCVAFALVTEFGADVTRKGGATTQHKHATTAVDSTIAFNQLGLAELIIERGGGRPSSPLNISERIGAGLSHQRRSYSRTSTRISNQNKTAMVAYFKREFSDVPGAM